MESIKTHTFSQSFLLKQYTMPDWPGKLCITFTICGEANERQKGDKKQECGVNVQEKNGVQVSHLALARASYQTRSTAHICRTHKEERQ